MPAITSRPSTWRACDALEDAWFAAADEGEAERLWGELRRALDALPRRDPPRLARVEMEARVAEIDGDARSAVRWRQRSLDLLVDASRETGYTPWLRRRVQTAARHLLASLCEADERPAFEASLRRLRDARVVTNRQYTRWMDRIDRELREVAHSDFAHHGNELHEQRNYAAALATFERSDRLVPGCPSVLYDRANTLMHLGRSREASALLEELLSTPDAVLRSRCSRAGATPRSIKTDAHYLLFWCALDLDEPWEAARGHLDAHLSARSRGLRSVFTKREVLRERLRQGREGQTRVPAGRWART